jgi:hypothetical protein
MILRYAHKFSSWLYFTTGRTRANDYQVEDDDLSDCIHVLLDPLSKKHLDILKKVILLVFILKF